jgi:molybdopterin/thiamine biosynthesis adenylyltransferase
VLTAEETERLAACLRAAPGRGGGLAVDGARRIAAEAALTLRQVEWYALGEGIVPERYSRNIGSVGVEGQRRLLERRVAVVGLGGLGGHVVESLARLGVGEIVGIDPDTFDESNLNRQLLSRADNLGAPKADAAGRRVARINPGVEFIARAERFEDAGDPDGHRDDAVLDCLDTIPARLALAGRCAEAGVVLVHGAIAGWCGQVGVVPPGSDALRKALAAGPRGIEAERGNLGFTAAVAANLMVAVAVPILLGEPAAERASFTFFDLQSGEWELIEL